MRKLPMLLRNVQSIRSRRKIQDEQGVAAGVSCSCDYLTWSRWNRAIARKLRFSVSLQDYLDIGAVRGGVEAYEANAEPSPRGALLKSSLFFTMPEANTHQNVKSVNPQKILGLMDKRILGVPDIMKDLWRNCLRVLGWKSPLKSNGEVETFV